MDSNVQDAIDEVREAVDFLRYYSNLAANVIPNKRKAMGISHSLIDQS
jgi:RHH-type proline utilization regulon transcriptional repressor/proline dehydrogenase/delta 1-pyrroline-5-carboxylate dehydrogenase